MGGGALASIFFGVITLPLDLALLTFGSISSPVTALINASSR
jgi:hypothetical protein